MSEKKPESEPISIENIEHLETRIREDILLQFEKQATILRSAGILYPSESEPGRLSFKDINGRECFLPGQDELFEYLEEEVMNTERLELIKRKYEQGFTRFQITPFGMKLDDLIEKYKEAILSQAEGQLYAAKKNPDDPAEVLVPLELDRQNPLYVWDTYKDADIKGTLVYHPKEFTKNHGGKTKKEILENQQKMHQRNPLSVFPGFHLKLLPKNPNIPLQEPQTIHDRIELDTHGSSITQYIGEGQTIPNPNEYLKALQENPMYQGEEGMTPEDQITLAIAHLKESNQVIDDYQGNGSVSYQLGGYFPASGNLPDAYWSRGVRRAFLYWSDPDDRSDYYGVRPAVSL